MEKLLTGSMQSNEFNNQIHKQASYIESLAYKSVVGEVYATPKPGLVDRKDNGAHDDMDYALFVDSAKAIKETFYRCAKAGLEFQSDDYTLFFDSLRELGKEGENAMFSATGGVNTHKGMIFSLSLVCGAAGTLYREKGAVNRQDLSGRIRKICRNLVPNDLKNLSEKTELTKGEKLYLAYGSTGIRGEAEGGYLSVTEHALPYFEKLLSDNLSLNDVMVNTVIKLMTITEDSNIAGRHHPGVLKEVRTWAERIIDEGGMETIHGSEEILKMNEQFIKRRISPGGCADLLAVTMMFYMLEKGEL